jgi:putative membrane protein
MPKLNKFQLNVLILLWIAALILTGASPHDRLTWLMEIFPVLIVIPILWLSHSRFPLPRYVYGWIFLHGLVLMIGGHYTYAEAPPGFWVRDFLGLTRNHFDRFGHLLQGFVPALVTREVLVRNRVVRHGVWLFFITLTICMAISVTYEFIEWWAALILGQGADAFLGTQGDPWDTQWDMFLATLGAIIAQIVYWKKKREVDRSTET